MPPRKASLPPPPDPQEDLDLADEMNEDRGIPDPRDPDWFRAQLGATLFGNPAEGNAPTKLPHNLSTTPVVASAGIDGADRWLVEIRNPETGQADYAGELPLSATPAQVIRRFLDAMPSKEGQPSAEVYFKALDKTGTKIGTASKPDGVFTVPWYNPILRELLRERTAQVPAPSGAEQLAAYLMRQMDEIKADQRAERQAAEAARQQAREMEQALLKQRLDHAANMQNDLGAAYSAVNMTQKEGFTSMMSAQERMALEREKREEERLRREREEEDRRRQRERDQHEEDRRRREEERKEERDRLRAEAAASLERVRAEADARVKEMELRARLEEAKIAAEVEKAKANATAELERMRLERERDDQRRKEERERQDRLDAAERERAREHQKDMEKIRTDAMDAAQKRLDAEAKRGEEHTRLVISLLEKHQNGGGGHKLGIVGELLDTFGMTIPDLIEKGKELIGGGATTSTAVAIVEGIGGVARELIKRLPMPDEAEEEEEEEPEDEEEEVQAPQPAQERRRAAPRQIAQQERPALLPAAVERQLGVSEPPDKVLSLEERRAGRKAVENVVTRLEGNEDWRVAVMDGQDVDALVRYVGLVGLRKALEGYDVDPERLGAVLVELGLFESSPLDPSVPEEREREKVLVKAVSIPESVPAYTVPQKDAPLYGKEGE